MLQRYSGPRKSSFDQEDNKEKKGFQIIPSRSTHISQPVQRYKVVDILPIICIFDLVVLHRSTRTVPFAVVKTRDHDPVHSLWIYSEILWYEMA